MKLTILIAEPRDILRVGLRSIFVEDERISHIEEARTQDDLLNSLYLHTSDLLIVNQMLLNPTIIETVLPPRRFVILATELNMELFKLIHSKQARGYLLETSCIDLLRIILTIGEDTFLVDPALTTQILEYFAFQERRQIDDSILTSREKEIVALLREGIHRNEIVDRLCISKATLKTHIKNINRKLDLASGETLVTNRRW